MTQTPSSKKKSNDSLNKIESLGQQLKSDIHEKMSEYIDRHRVRDMSLYFDLQADVLSYKQILIEQMYRFDELLYKKSCRVKQLRWNAMEKLKTTNAILKQKDEKIIFIEADVAEEVREYEAINTIIAFLSNSIKNLDNLTWAIKGSIDIIFKHGDII